MHFLACRSALIRSFDHNPGILKSLPVSLVIPSLCLVYSHAVSIIQRKQFYQQKAVGRKYTASQSRKIFLFHQLNLRVLAKRNTSFTIV